MKSDHRHELKTNELGRLLDHAKPFFDRYSNYLLIGLAVAVVIVAVAVFRWSSTSSGELAWAGILKAENAEHYATVADDYPKSQAAGWARLREAESHLNNGIHLAFSDRDGAISDLKKSQEEFKQLVDNASLPVEIRVRAQFGLARMLEVLSDGTNEDAIAAYNKVRKLEDPVYTMLADQRITALGKADSKEFYAWFHKQNPKPADRKQPKDGLNPDDFFGPGKGAGEDTLNPTENLDLPGTPAPTSPDVKSEPAPKSPTLRKNPPQAHRRKRNKRPARRTSPLSRMLPQNSPTPRHRTRHLRRRLKSPAAPISRNERCACLQRADRVDRRSAAARLARWIIISAACSPTTAAPCFSRPSSRGRCG